MGPKILTCGFLLWSKYEAEKRWRKRQQKIKNNLCESTKGNTIISTQQYLKKIAFGIRGQMA